MEIHERASGDVTILDLKGRLILGDGEQPFRELVDGLADKGSRRLLLNFAGVTFLDSAGIGSIVWKYVTMKKQRGAVKLMHLTKRSRDILQITRLATVLETFDSEEEAVRSFEASDRS